jgi:hypothetical protein
MQFGGEYYGVPKIEVRLRGGRTYNLVTAQAVTDAIRKAWTDFEAARAEVVGKVHEIAAEAPATSAATTAKVQVEAQPGGAEFYVDDQFKGTTSREGRLAVTDLAPGEHRLRLSRKGYQEWSRTVTLTAGETRTVEVQLTEAVPETALKLEDVVKLLEAGVTPTRLETIVRERGVAFELTAEAERKLRDAGATADLLLAIAKAKK